MIVFVVDAVFANFVQETVFIMEASSVQINVPKKDLPFLRKMAKGMGWTITSPKKNGVELGLEDIKAGRINHAANAEDMLAQILG